MEKEFIYEAQFRKWVEKKKGNADTFISRNRNYLNNSESEYNESEYKKNFFFYVPSLIASDRKDIAMKLLARVYVDIVLIDYKHSSFFKEYCRFISKTKFNDIEKLTSDEIDKIENEVQNDEIWICNSEFSKYFRVKNTDKTLYQLFSIRVLSWNRRYFPLDFIKKCTDKIDKETIDNWVADTINNITVFTQKDNKTIKYKFSDILIFVLKKKNDKYEVDVITKAKDSKKEKRNPERLTMMTPLALNGLGRMEVRGLMDISIDHLIPLELIVRQLREKKDSAIKTIADAYDDDPEKAESVFSTIDYEKLKSELTSIREDAHCRLMLRNENSKKSNNTQYQRYDRKKKGVYQMIIAENVDNPVDKKKYKIFRTLKNNNFSEVEMQKEK